MGDCRYKDWPYFFLNYNIPTNGIFYVAFIIGWSIVFMIVYVAHMQKVKYVGHTVCYV